MVRFALCVVLGKCSLPKPFSFCPIGQKCPPQERTYHGGLSVVVYQCAIYYRQWQGSDGLTRRFRKFVMAVTLKTRTSQERHLSRSCDMSAVPSIQVCNIHLHGQHGHVYASLSDSRAVSINETSLSAAS